MLTASMWHNVASSAQAQCQAQRIFQIAAHKAQMEMRGVTLSYPQLAELYSAKVKVSAGEQVTQTFCRLRDACVLPAAQ